MIVDDHAAVVLASSDEFVGQRRGNEHLAERFPGLRVLDQRARAGHHHSFQRQFPVKANAVLVPPA